jgi:hypothetical protein
MADALYYGLQAASSRVKKAEAQLHIHAFADHPDVVESVAYAEGLAQEFVQAAGAAPGDARLFEQYVAEAVVLGASSRAEHRAPPMTPEEVKRVRDFFEFIFNGLFHR